MKKLVIFLTIIFLFCGCTKETAKIKNFVGMDVREAEVFAKKNNIKIKIEEQYDEKIKKGSIIAQSYQNHELMVTVSKGKSPDYKALGVNELGDVPIMMYHGIQDVESKYTGGNIDKDGYQRTKEAFIKDLEFYYENGYRMIRLYDFVNQKVDVPLGKSPLILTFDDGKNNIKVTGIDKNGNLIIDPNCAVGILESWKEKYPDYGVTATFFLNSGLFESEYNEQILTWLIKHGYDIGNHSFTHPDFSKITIEQASLEIGKMYTLLDTIIPKKYVPIVALPFGSPYSKEHPNFSSILNSIDQNNSYETIATLRVGWEANPSCFSKNFDRTFLKRIRAYDHEGSEFDIEMNFENLSKTRFISDGNIDTITVPKELENFVLKNDLKRNVY